MVNITGYLQLSNLDKTYGLETASQAQSKSKVSLNLTNNAKTHLGVICVIAMRYKKNNLGPEQQKYVCYTEMRNNFFNMLKVCWFVEPSKPFEANFQWLC